MPEIRVSQELIDTAMQSQVVRDALVARRDKSAARANALLASEHVEGQVTTEEGTRPRGRPYARVVLDNVDQEWGTSKSERRRILGRSR